MNNSLLTNTTWRKYAAISALGLLPAFVAYSSESDQSTAAPAANPQATQVASADGHNHGESEHAEAGHSEAAAGHHDDAAPGFGHPAKPEQADRTIEIEAVDLAFKPVSIEVKKGETIKFVVANTGNLEHEFVLGTASEQKEHAKEMQAMQGSTGMAHHSDSNAITIPAGETKTLTWTFTQAMPVEFACHIPGHYEAGMHGDIQVQ